MSHARIAVVVILFLVAGHASAQTVDPNALPSSGSSETHDSNPPPSESGPEVPSPALLSAYTGGKVILAPTSAERREFLAERLSIEDRLSSLKAQQSQTPILGPVILMSIGYGLTVASCAAALRLWLFADDVKRGQRVGDYDEYTRGEIDSYRQAARWLAGGSALPLAAGIAGTVWLVRRLPQRRRLAAETDALHERLERLERHLQYGVSVGTASAALTVSGYF